MRSLDRLLLHLQRALALGAPPPPTRPDSVPMVPTRRRPRSVPRALVGIASALVIPVGFGALLIVWRDELGTSISLLMVLPMLLIALAGGPRLATVAALAGAAAFDVFHTLPYYRFRIDDRDDVVETLVLLAIGVTTGVLADAARRALVVAHVRHEELTAISDFIGHIGTSLRDRELAERAGACICHLLSARECTWKPDYRGTVHPVLRSDGTLTTGAPGGSGVRDGELPPSVEIPVGYPPRDHGRFVVRSDRRTSVSLEERRAAATVAATLARCLDGVVPGSAADAEGGSRLVGDDAGGA